MSKVAKHEVSVRHSEETGLSGDKEAPGPEHSEL